MALDVCHGFRSLRGLASWTALCALPMGNASAWSVDELTMPAIAVVSVVDGDSPVDVRNQLRLLIDEGQKAVLAGPSDVLAQMKPDGVHAWPATNTIVLDPGATLGIFGFNAGDDEERRSTLRQWPWGEDVFPVGSVRPRRELHILPGQRHVEFSLVASTPSQVCRQFSRRMADSLFSDVTPSRLQQRAFRREVRRWCQYGNLSVHAAEPPAFTIEPFRGSNELRLSLVAEWALIRSEDRADEAKNSYLFWTKTIGEGAGTGFTRRHGEDAWYDPASGAVHSLMDAAIHSGWGSIEDRDVVTAWPLNSSFPQSGNVHVFRCDSPEAFRPADCPFMPLLRKLYPDDSFDGAVTVSAGESINVGGDAKISRSMDTEGKVALSMTFGLNMMRSESSGRQLEMALTQTRGNGDVRYYRSIWWLPDIGAIQRWIATRGHSGSLAKATPLAGTLNPRHEILWELLLSENGGRRLPYHVVYEAGWNTCVHGTWCADYRKPAHSSLPAKARVGWSDGIVVNLPAR